MNGRPLIIATALVAILAAPCMAAKTAFRINAIYWRDPHLTANVSGCVDLTDVPLAGYSFNGATNANLQADANGDGLLDQNYVLIFDPLDQTPSASGYVTFMYDGLCSAPAWQSACLSKPVPFQILSTYSSQPGPCLGLLPISVAHSYTPAITLPSGPCFTAYFNNLTLYLGGITLPLQDVAIGATYDGTPANNLVNGLIRGFITDISANNMIVPAWMPIGGGQPLSHLFPGGEGNCSPWSDADLTYFPMFYGWAVYLNFTAEKVPWFEDYPVPVRDGALALTLDAPHPNPFNPSTEIHYVLPHASRIQISIYDATGRVVSELADEEQVKGDHSVHWDGRDGRGGVVSSGVYFVRLEANGETRTQKMVLLK